MLFVVTEGGGGHRPVASLTGETCSVHVVEIGIKQISGAGGKGSAMPFQTASREFNFKSSNSLR